MVPTQDVVLALHSSAGLFPGAVGAVVAVVVAALAVSLALVAVPRKDAD